MARIQLHHHLQGKADPSDLVQEVCLAAHGNLADFRGLTSEEFAAWLRGILSNILQFMTLLESGKAPSQQAFLDCY